MDRPVDWMEIQNAILIEAANNPPTASQLYKRLSKWKEWDVSAELMHLLADAKVELGKDYRLEIVKLVDGRVNHWID